MIIKKKRKERDKTNYSRYDNKFFLQLSTEIERKIDTRSRIDYLLLLLFFVLCMLALFAYFFFIIFIIIVVLFAVFIYVISIWYYYCVFFVLKYEREQNLKYINIEERKLETKKIYYHYFNINKWYTYEVRAHKQKL